MFFPEALLNSPMFGIGLTIIVYVFCELIVNRFELNIIPPFVLACPIIMGIIYFQSPHITYEQYAAGANFINFLLGPATVALALPLYRNRQTLKNNLAYDLDTFIMRILPSSSAELLSLQSSALFPSSSAASCLAPANRFCFL